MRTARNSSRRGGVWSWSPWISPLGVGLDLIPLNFHLGCGPGSDPPQFPPWLWAWIWSPSISPLGVGLDLIPLNFPPWVWACIWSPSISPLSVGLDLIPLNFPPGCGPGGVVSLAGGSLVGGRGSPWGVSLVGGLPGRRGLPGRGVSLPGRGVSLLTESQTPVKI